MRATLAEIPREAVEERRRRGIDRFDEVWEGVYHVVPSPDWVHQKVDTRLAAFLDDHCARHHLGQVNASFNVREPGTGQRNYRVPDVVFVSKARSAIIGEKWIEGGPDVVLEIRSPGDDTYKKFPFYALVAVPTVVVLRGRRRRIEVYRRVRGTYKLVDPGRTGRMRIDALGVTLRAVRGGGKIGVEVASTLGDRAVAVLWS